MQSAFLFVRISKRVGQIDIFPEPYLNFIYIETYVIIFREKRRDGGVCIYETLGKEKKTICQEYFCIIITLSVKKEETKKITFTHNILYSTNVIIIINSIFLCNFFKSKRSLKYLLTT